MAHGTPTTDPTTGKASSTACSPPRARTSISPARRPTASSTTSASSASTRTATITVPSFGNERSQRMSVNEAKLQEFMGQAVCDVGAAMSAALVVIGDKLGLYKGMAAAGAVTPAELAQRTGTNERYVREWLNNQAAGGYVSYDAASGRYTLPPEQAFALADESSPVFLPGAFQVVLAALKAEPRIAENFRTGAGLGWGEHDPELFEGVERFFRPSYAGNLISAWIPALDGVEEKLRAGAKAADVGCGHGASTILMAQAFPNSRFVGFDFHPPSIETARQRAQAAGVADRVHFEVARSTDYPGDGYDFVAHFD